MAGAVHKDFKGTAYQPQEEVYVRCSSYWILLLNFGLTC